jgi:hypothetical protein
MNLLNFFHSIPFSGRGELGVGGGGGACGSGGGLRGYGAGGDLRRRIGLHEGGRRGRGGGGGGGCGAGRWGWRVTGLLQDLYSHIDLGVATSFTLL